MSSFNTQFATRRLREEDIEETSATGGEGAYLTKPGAKRVPPKPTSGYKEVKGFKKGHTKLNFMEPKELWELNKEKFNEVGEKDEPETVMNYQSGDKIANGDKIKINTPTIEDGRGFVSGFTKNADDEDVVLVTVDSQYGSSVQVRDVQVRVDQIEKKDDAPSEEPLQEGVKQGIRNRSNAEQFHEAAKQANKKLDEVNKILEYAMQLRSQLQEDNTKQSVHTSRLMEKVRKRMVSAYKKIKEINE